MSSTPSRAGAAYEPLVPSPLNPRSCEAEGLALRRRRNTGGSSSMAARRSTTTAGMSPAERLLRHKAAQAWRMQVLRLEAPKARQIKAAAPRPELCPREVVDISAVSTVGGPRDEREPAEEKRRAAPDEGEPRAPHYDYLFRMPEVGFFTPQRLVLAMGAKRMMPLASPHEVLHSARARREREEGRRRTELRMT